MDWTGSANEILKWGTLGVMFAGVAYLGIKEFRKRKPNPNRPSKENNATKSSDHPAPR